jgi:hypothetical protein
MQPEHASEQNGFCAPGAIVLDGKVHLFYQTYGNREKDAVCHAWSTDGINFTRDPTNPIFRPQGRWTCGRAIDAEVFEDGDRLLLYFASRDPSYKTQLVGVAAAPRRSDLSRCHRRRKVPRSCQQCNANRLTRNHQPICAAWRPTIVAVNSHCLFAKPAKELGCISNFGSRIAQHFSVFKRYQSR